MTDPVAVIDQAAAMVADVARVVASYHKALTASGIDPRDATALTIAYQALLIGDA